MDVNSNNYKEIMRTVSSGEFALRMLAGQVNFGEIKVSEMIELLLHACLDSKERYTLKMTQDVHQSEIDLLKTRFDLLLKQLKTGKPILL